MVLGVKYCGGCNPRYDRRKAVEALLAGNEEDRIVSAQAPDVDVILVVCGCSSRCASHRELEGKRGKWVLSEPVDFEALRQALEGMKGSS